MTLDWNAFTPWTSLAGGIVIGLASAMLVLLNGRVAGISGIVGALLQPPPPGERAWRVVFILGLLVSPWVYRLFAAYPIPTVDASGTALILAGLLVGMGTRYASGCTSGHGICGLSRFSLRSLVATGAFMGAGFALVAVVRHLIV